VVFPVGPANCAMGERSGSSFHGNASGPNPNYCPVPTSGSPRVLSHSAQPLLDPSNCSTLGRQNPRTHGWWSDDSWTIWVKLSRSPADQTSPLPSGGFVVFTRAQFNDRSASSTVLCSSLSARDEVYLSAGESTRDDSQRENQWISARLPIMSGFGRVTNHARRRYSVARQSARNFGIENAGSRLVGPCLLSGRNPVPSARRFHVDDDLKIKMDFD